ncbi:hypothetical protein [Candidatus Igneacidithiobacillus taiwanensis]|uniref:hypothetical protein n=1 Tax=Candidatus Igneacidithiobacillus taiwanensis TaxID=1945924 RepID=UPI00289C6B36|nr:hypothetical protein [Candidatus Igneacidithiobacillus taiwanensis]MCE5361372.1 sel1 repeat family protein [Acidithiobacillus sp.]
MNAVRVEVSTATASLLTGRATKTLYRWVDDGSLPARHGDGDWTGSKIGGRLSFALSDLAPHMRIPITPDLERELGRVEQGVADGFNEIGLMFFEHKAYEIGIHWLEMAAKKGHADAMDWLSTCYLEGLGTKMDHARAIEWLGKAAAAGHPLAKEKVASLDR